MSASVVFSRKKKEDENGWLYIMYKKKGFNDKKVSLEFPISKANFTKFFMPSIQQFNKTTVIDYKLLNNRINELKDKDVFNEKPKEYQFLEYFLTRRDLLNTQATKNTYNTCMENFKEYLKTINRDDISFKEIDYEFILKLQKFLDKKGLEPSSIRFYFNTYSSIFNKAAKSKVYIYPNPFDEIDTITVNAKPKKVLKELDIKILKDIKPTDKYFIESRMFLFSFFGNGMRCSDMMMMKNEDIQRENIEYIQMKIKKPIKLKYGNSILEILLGVYGLNDYISGLRNTHKSTEPYNISYNEARTKLLSILNKDYYGKEGIEYIMYRGWSIISNDDEVKDLIQYLKDVNGDINVAARNKLYKHIKTLNPTDLVFKDFVQSDVFEDYDKMNGFNDEQFLIYKRRFSCYNNKIKRMAKMYDLSITDITTHVARFTFTNDLLDMDSINLNDVRIALGHTSLSTTEKYIQKGFDFKKSDSLNELLSNKYD